ncbi:MAG: thioredoxin [Planctomycetaceae bacterium]|nr:thioredoxin [Planctomycetaceae bacterium]
MAESTWVREITADSFQQDVVDQSMERLVLVDFWAPWCEPCRQLGPMLEKLAAEFNGRFLLTKVNIDESPELAGAFRVQSIPAVFAIQQGQPVDQFQGVMPEGDLKEWISALLPSPTEELLVQGQALEATDPAAAEKCYRDALEHDESNDRAKVALARVLVLLERDDEASRLIARLEERGFLEPEAEKLKHQLELRAAAEEAGSVTEAREAVEASPDDMQLRIRLADALAGDRKFEDAMKECLLVVERDRDGAGEDARRTMVQIFDTLGPSSELVGEYRRRLATLLY